jgi:glyoxylase-like metal-dependent hydrolase (beta-lactamase superfamily II)
MERVHEGTYRLGSSHHNFYVVVDGGKATVIDAGCFKEWPVLVSGLAEIGLGPDDVEAIIVTHAHADHIGFGKEAQDNGLRVKVHEHEEPRALGTYEGKTAITPMQMPLWKPAVWGFLVALLKVGILKQPALESVETFTDGEVLDLPGRPRVIHTPGHTEGHASFLVGSTLFSGDAVVMQDLFGRDRTTPFVMQDAFHNDPRLVWESLDVVAGIRAERVLPGHGDPFPGTPAEMVRMAKTR